MTVVIICLIMAIAGAGIAGFWAGFNEGAHRTHHEHRVAAATAALDARRAATGTFRAGTGVTSPRAVPARRSTQPGRPPWEHPARRAHTAAEHIRPVALARPVTDTGELRRLRVDRWIAEHCPDVRIPA